MRLKVMTVIVLIAVLMVPAANSWTPAHAQDGTTVHVVQPGENLYRIALAYNMTWPVLAAANGIVNPNIIYVGQQIVIPDSDTVTPSPTPVPTSAPQATATPVPSASTYVVQAGDNLYRIATQFNTSITALVQANGIVNPNLIYVGQVLNIPGGSGQPTQPAPTPQPGQPTNTPVPQQPSGSFELGGHVDSFAYPDLMRQAGMTWVKRQVRYNLGDSPDMVAGAINQAHNQGFRILLGIVGDPNELAAGGSTYMDQYAGFLGGVAALGPDAIEVWNEQNIDREWPTGQINPATYVQMLAKAYSQIKNNNASVMVITGAPAPTGAEGAYGTDRVWNDDRYIQGMAAAGATNYADCIGVHYNEGIVGPDQTSGDPRADNYYTRYFQSMISVYWNTFGGADPLCFTELGYLSPEGYGPLPSGFEWAANTSVAEQAQWLARAAQIAQNYGSVRLMIVWNVDFTLYDADPMAGYAIVRPGGSCPACQALDQVMP